MSRRVEMVHGAGGRATSERVEELFRAAFANPWLDRRDDQAILALPPGRIGMTTDAFVIAPLVFPGGDIGSLAVHGTANDLAMAGARPLHLSASFILEEGLDLDLLAQLAGSMARAVLEAGVTIVTGDTGVLERGKGDGLFVTTTGIGLVPEEVEIGARRARPCDVVLASGTLGDHGIAIMAKRAELGLETELRSDSAPLHGLVAAMLEAVPDLHALCDPTRGGLAATLNEIAHEPRVGFRLREAAMPVRHEVLGVCELLCLDPLDVANEGKLDAICAEADAERLLAAMRAHPLGREAAVIGRVVEDPQRLVELETRLGGRRLFAWRAGEPRRGSAEGRRDADPARRPCLQPVDPAALGRARAARPRGQPGARRQRRGDRRGGRAVPPRPRDRLLPHPRAAGGDHPAGPLPRGASGPARRSRPLLPRPGHPRGGPELGRHAARGRRRAGRRARLGEPDVSDARRHQEQPLPQRGDRRGARLRARGARPDRRSRLSPAPAHGTVPAAPAGRGPADRLARDPTELVLRKIRSADGSPGVDDDLPGLPVRLFDAHLEGALRGPAGAVIARREEAICRATIDGAVWLGWLRPPAPEGERPFEMPATTALADRLAAVPEVAPPLDPAIPTWRPIAYTEEGAVGRLRFQFRAGALSTAQARRLDSALRRALAQPIRVLVLEGGPDFWCSGMNLATIEAAASPAAESMANIEAIDDLAETLIRATGVRVIAALAGDAGAGGAFLALAADGVIARSSVLLSPHYENIGNLYGSEYWTYLLPRRTAERGRAVVEARLPVGAAEARALGLVDTVLELDGAAFEAGVRDHARRFAADPALPRRLAEKARRLAAYRTEELARMRESFFAFDPSYHVARYHFLARVPQARTPFHLARHRATGAAAAHSIRRTVS